jgi:hypothetical protein
MTHPLLERIPARGITKAEHDRYVDMHGRPYTDPYVLPHLKNRANEGGTVPPHSTQTPIDYKAHRQVLH